MLQVKILVLRYFYHLISAMEEKEQLEGYILLFYALTSIHNHCLELIKCLSLNEREQWNNEEQKACFVSTIVYVMDSG